MAQDLFKYRPSLYSPQALQESLVGRETLLKRLLQAIDQGRRRKGLQNFLLTGPRGIGKTHLLLLLHHSVRGTLRWQGIPADLHRDWVSLLFPEESYRISSLAELLLEALNMLQAESPDAQLLALLQRCNRVMIPGEPERELLINYLAERKKHDGKRFLFLIDNLQNLLRSFTEEDQGRLRDLLMRGDWLMIIGAAPTLFKEVQDHQLPFYNFFEVIRIPEIKPAEIETLLKRRLKLDDRTELLKDFESRRPRLQAILHLTGGNPRLILSLYRIFAEAEIVEVERSFLALLDDLTPYFQDRMNELAPQQRKIVDAISLMDGPSTPTELAGAARLNVNAVTTQLRRLEKEGYVKSHKERGKKATLYDITERLFRLWRQVSVEAGRRRLRVIVKFLESWFTPQELLRYSALTLSAMEHALSAEKYEMVKALTEKLYYYQEAMPLPEIRASLHFTRIYGLEKSGDKASSDQEVQQLFAEANSKGDQALLARAWWGKAFVHHEREDIHGEIDALSQYLTFNPDDAKAHYNYALLLVDQDRVKEAEEHLQQALRINPHLSAVWGALGSLYMQMGKFALALKKIERVYQLAQEQENKELVEAAAILAFFTRLMLSFKNAQRHNLKQAANHLTKGLAYLPDMPSDSAQKPLGQYLNAVLQFRQPALLEQALDQIEAAGSADLSEFVKPYRAALRYHQTKDKAILNRLFPEIREIVEEMVRQLEAS